MIYLNLASTDSFTFHPTNTSYDFTVELPQPIRGEFTCALLDFTCDSMLEELYIFTDICQPEFIHDSVLPLLRIVTEPGEVNIEHYKPMSRQVVQRVRIYIRDRHFNVPTQNIGPVRVTIALDPI